MTARQWIDVALESPARLHIAVRSFFEQPMQVFATDGATMTIFDSTHPEGPRFYRGAVTGHALSGLFPFCAAPPEPSGWALYAHHGQFWRAFWFPLDAGNFVIH